MDLLLTHGFFLDDDPAEQKIMKPYPPLGLLYISAYLKQRGFAVEVFDSTFASLAALKAYISAQRPPVVGVYANMVTKFSALEIIAHACAEGCTVIVGGPDPPYYAEAYLEHGADVVVIGEGEETLAELLPALAMGGERLGGIAGIVYRDGEGRVQRTAPRPLLADLDALPLPDRGAIDYARYLDAWRHHHGYGPASLITARGCPFRCTWCSHSVFGHTLRKRSPQHVAQEVAWLQEHFRPDALWYADDVFNIDRKWLRAYAGELERRDLRLPFECICRADLLSDELLGLLRTMGCFRLWIGSESGSQRLLDAMQRRVKIEQVQAMTRLAKRHGIETGMFLMWGYEDENGDDIAQTIEHVKKAAPDIVLTTVSYPIKGTEYYARMEEQQRIVEDGPWAETNDRHSRIRGRHSRRYYDFANRWLYSELELQRLDSASPLAPRRLKAQVNAGLGRLGMVLTSWQREA